MKSLTQHLKECEGGGGAMPSNTLGAGNPGLVGPSTLSEPLTQGEINRQPTAKTKVEDPETSKTKKNKKKKHMKDLKEHLNDLLFEAKECIEIMQSQASDIIDYGSKFDPNTGDESAWDKWGEYNIDPEWAQKHKSYMKKLCKICNEISKNRKIHYGSTELGNFPYDDSYAQQELLADQFNPKEGEMFYFLTCDGDDGMFFYMQIEANADSRTHKLASEFSEMIIGIGNWDWEIVEYRG